MDPTTAAAIVVGGFGLVGSAIAVITGRGKPGISDKAESPKAEKMATEATIRALANGSAEMTVVNVGQMLVAMAKFNIAQSEDLTAAKQRIDQLESHEVRYLQRITVLEEWGRWSTEPPPRNPPVWDNRPDPPGGSTRGHP
jgi:hypothetical protein